MAGSLGGRRAGGAGGGRIPLYLTIGGKSKRESI